MLLYFRYLKLSAKVKPNVTDHLRIFTIASYYGMDLVQPTTQEFYLKDCALLHLKLLWFVELFVKLLTVLKWEIIL